jgi:hypothetical protein
MRRIFISHRNGEAEVIDLIEQLSASARDAGYDVLVDFARLKPGASWRDDIYTWLGVCHVGIVLISPSALAADSIWVPRECSILSWRKTLDKSFTILPVFLSGVTADDLRNDLRYRDLGFHDLHAISHDDSATTCSRIMDHLGPGVKVDKTELERLAEVVEAQLAGVPRDAIEEGLERCGQDLRALPSFGDMGRRLALGLLEVPLMQALGVLEYLAHHVPRPGAVRKILELIAPGWVDVSAARWVAHCTSKIDRRPAAVLNASSLFAARMYVRRASVRPPETARVVSVTGVHGELAFEDLATEVMAALQKDFENDFLSDPFLDESAQLLAVLQELDRLGRPVVVVLRLPVGARELMPHLQERFPYLAFLFLSGSTLPDEAACPVALLRRVEPALLDGREALARIEYQTAQSTLCPGGQPR